MAAGNDAPRRPGWVFKAVCIAAIVLGGLGFLSGVSSLAALVWNDEIQHVTAPRSGPGRSDEFARLQQEMQTEMQKIADRWKAANVVLACFQLVTVTGLVIGGILGLRQRALGRAILVSAFAVGVVLEAARIPVTVAIQRGTMEVTNRFMGDLMRATAPAGGTLSPDLSSFVGSLTGASMMAGVAFALAAALLKIGFYLFGAVSLGRRSAKDAFPAARREPAERPPF